MQDGPPEARPKRSRAFVLAYRALGAVALALGAAGLVLPLVPTTVFLLIALWAFARGSPEWALRLRASPRFGPLIRNWEERRAIPRRAKALAVLMMAVSWTALAVSAANPWLLAALGTGLAAIAVWIVTRPAA